MLKSRVLKKVKWLLYPLLAFLGGCSLRSYPLADPAGPVGHAELHLIVVAFLIMLIPVIPVIFMTLWFAWRYRATNKSATYKPGWAHSNKIEVVIWLVPFVIVLGLSILSWETTHQLNPYNRLAAAKAEPGVKPVRIDVIALNWKWLFVYPKQHIASVNELVIPTGVPVDFHVTSDTVMTSFFVPRLGTQIYAMAGMRTKLHLMATHAGTYFGENNQISGIGYSEMNFKVIATSARGYSEWLTKVRRSPNKLDLATYRKLEQPTISNPVTYYSSVVPDTLFKHVIGKYMHGMMTAGKAAKKRSLASHINTIQ